MAQEHSQGKPEGIPSKKQLSHEEEMELRQSTIAEAMKLWHSKAETYRTAPLEYKYLADKRRRSGVYPLNLVPRAVLKEYPYIEFFYCLDEVSAREYLGWLSTSELVILLNNIVEMVELNPAYIGITRKNIELRYFANRGLRDTYCCGLRINHRNKTNDD